MINRIRSLLGVAYPIVQAPMTYIARAELAAAVSEAGGLGMIETLTPEGRTDLRRVREFTDEPVAANLMIQGWKNDPSIVDVLAEAGVRHVFTSAGDPALFTERLHDAGMTVVHVIGSLRAAMKAADAGVDALVVEGVEGGGFKSALGASTMVLLPLVAERIDLPIIAAGGMCDARSSAAALVLGAEGVQMGTRMLASRESLVHANFKDAIVAANDSGTVLLDIPGDPTMRVLRTGLAARVAADDPDVQLLGKITDLYFDGDMEASVANTGQVSSRIAELLPVAEIVRRTWDEIEAALEAARARIRVIPQRHVDARLHDPPRRLALHEALDGGVVDHHVQRAPVGPAEGGCDRPAAVDRDAMGHGAAGDDAEELAGVEAANPHPSFDVDAEAVGVAFGSEVGENAWCTEAAVGFGRERENPRPVSSR